MFTKDEEARLHEISLLKDSKGNATPEALQAQEKLWNASGRIFDPEVRDAREILKYIDISGEEDYYG